MHLSYAVAPTRPRRESLGAPLSRSPPARQRASRLACRRAPMACEEASRLSPPLVFLAARGRRPVLPGAATGADVDLAGPPARDRAASIRSRLSCSAD